MRQALIGMGIGAGIVGGIAGTQLGSHAFAGAVAQDKDTVVVPKPEVGLDGTYNPTRSFAPLVTAVEPAVVAIEVDSVRKGPDLNQIPPMFRGFIDPRAFGDQPQHGEGSGFVVSSDGFVLTNHHVIDHADSIKVRFSDGTTAKASVVGSDQGIDVALLKLEGDQTWPSVKLGKSEGLQVGDWVLAVGNPLGLGTTVTAGIISGKGRALGQNVWDDFLQTDASINPGNSGGPLFNLDGEVVGINTAIIAGANTVGFAIPIDMVKDVIDDLRDHGHVSRGYIGVTSEPTDEKGALVSQVYADTPAQRAGLEIGDRIVAVDADPVEDPADLVKAIGRHDPGDKVALEIVREGKKRKLDVLLGERPSDDAPPPAAVASKGSFGLSLKPLPPNDAQRLQVYGGVEVTEVQKGTAGQGFLRPGDIIVEVNQWPVNSPEQVEELLSRSGAKALISILRDGARKTVVIPLK